MLLAGIALTGCDKGKDEPNVVITIETQPQDITVTQGEITGSVSVVASVAPNATLTYQWYSNSTDSNRNGVALGGETSASFVLPVTLEVGEHYFYCVVGAEGATAVHSEAATVTVEAEKPVITIQSHPAPISVTEGDITESLSVTATVSQGETLAYQWYSNTTASSTGGTPIENSTDATWPIPSTLTAGAYHYFCELSSERADPVRTEVATVTVTDAGESNGYSIDELVGDWNVTSFLVEQGQAYIADYTVTFSKIDATTLEIKNFLGIIGVFSDLADPDTSGHDTFTATYDSDTQTISVPVQLLGDGFDPDGWPAYLFPYRYADSAANYEDKSGFVNLPVTNDFVIDFATENLIGTIDGQNAYSSFYPLTQEPGGTNVYNYGFYYVNSVFTKADATPATKAAPAGSRSFDLMPLGGNAKIRK